MIYKKLLTGGQEKKVQVGEEVWASQGIIVIPAMATLKIGLALCFGNCCFQLFDPLLERHRPAPRVATA